MKISDDFSYPWESREGITFLGNLVIGCEIVGQQDLSATDTDWKAVIGIIHYLLGDKNNTLTDKQVFRLTESLIKPLYVDHFQGCTHPSDYEEKNILCNCGDYEGNYKQNITKEAEESGLHSSNMPLEWYEDLEEEES